VSRTGYRLWGIAISLIAASAALAPRESSAVPADRFKKVMIIVFENTNYSDVLKQPYFSSLIARGALLTNFSGVAHPSQPNYIAMISGSTHAVISDLNVNIDDKHVGDLLEAKGMGWKVYAESYPGGCFLGSRSGDYVRKHVPFLSFKNVQSDPARCQRIVDASALNADVQSGKVPEYSMYIPNLKSDGHDTGVAFADKWFAATFGPLLKDPKFTQDMLLVVTFDESETYIGNHVATILVGDSVLPATKSSASYNHYSVLKTIEDEFGLGALDENDHAANDIIGVWK
jgi:hypothetical protein